MCRTEGVVYSIISQGGLEEEGLTAEYTGESGRSLYCRGQEHKKALANEEEESPLWKHCASKHNGIHQAFKLKLVRKHQSAFQRQVHESILITNGPRDMCLNSKSEWNAVKDTVKQLDYDGQAIPNKKRGLSYNNNHKNQPAEMQPSSKRSKKSQATSHQCHPSSANHILPLTSHHSSASHTSSVSHLSSAIHPSSASHIPPLTSNFTGH